MIRKLPATFGLIGLNVAIFLLAYHLLPGASGGAGGGNVLTERLPLYFPRNADFGVWQFVTHMFMHGGTGHLFMNMFGLFSFGAVLERIWGVKRFLIFYFAAGIGAGLIYTGINEFEFRSITSSLVEQGMSAEQIETLGGITDPNTYSAALMMLDERLHENLVDLYYKLNVPMVGASGAIYGILTAFGLLFPDAKLSLIFLPVPVAAKYFIPALLLLDFFSGVTGFSIFGGGIAHFAHLGGALIGFLLMMLWRGDVSEFPEFSPVLE